MGWATVNLLVGGIVVGLLVLVGLVLLVVPGLYLIASFALFHFYVAVEDDGFVAAMKKSWNLASGHRLRVFVVLLLLSVVSSVVSNATQLLFGSSGLGLVVTSLLSGVVSVYAVAVLADVFVQLRRGSAEESADEEPSADDAVAT